MLYANEGIYNNTLDIYGHFTCGPNPYLCTANTGNAVAQMLLGLPDGGSAGIASRPAASMHFYAWYLQDDWHVIPKLTLNLGIRYEIQGAPTYRRNEGAYFDPESTTRLDRRWAYWERCPARFSTCPRGIAVSTKLIMHNLSPRIGFSYQALPKLIFRGGYGIFFPISISQEEATTDGYSPNTAVVSSLNAGVNAAPGLTLENPWPNGFVQPTGNSLGALQDVGYGTSAVFRQRPSSYVQQYMLGLQYGFTPNDSLELNYYGSHGTHMLSGNGISHTQVDPS